MGIINKIKKFFMPDENLPGVEFHPESKKRDPELEGWLYDLYNDAFDALKSMSEEWQQNRRAFLGESKDHYGGWGTVSDKQGNESQICTNMVADKMGDLVAMQIQSKPTVFPLPNGSEEVERADAEGRAIVPGWSPDNPDGMSQVAYVQKWVEAVFNDIRRYQKETTKNIKMALDGRLCRMAIVKIYPVFDSKKDQWNIKREIIQNEDFAADPSAFEWEEIGYEFQNTRKTLFDACSKFPEFKEELRNALKNESGKDISAPGMEQEARSFKGLVTIVEGYFKDLTTEKIPNPDYQPTEDPMTGELIEDENEKNIEVPKYPEGRRITFLVDKGTGGSFGTRGGVVILKDEPSPLNWNPFSSFVPDPVSWSIYGRNQASPIYNIQVAADNALQQGQANVRACANNHIYYLESQVDEEKLKNAVGAHIPVENLDAIREIAARPVLGDIANFYGMLESISNRVSGVTDTGEGRASGGVTSGRAFGMLSAMVDRKVEPSKDAFAETLEDIWRKNAEYALDIYEAGRFLTTSDEDRLPVRLPFTLRDYVDAIDVQVDSDSHFPADPISRFKMWMELAQTKDGDGFPFADRDAVFKEAKIPGGTDTIRRIRRKFEEMTALKNAQNAMGPAGATAAQAGTGGSQPTPESFDNMMGGMGPEGRPPG